MPLPDGVQPLLRLCATIPVAGRGTWAHLLQRVPAPPIAVSSFLLSLSACLWLSPVSGFSTGTNSIPCGYSTHSWPLARLLTPGQELRAYSLTGLPPCSESDNSPLPLLLSASWLYSAGPSLPQLLSQLTLTLPHTRNLTGLSSAC